MDEKRSGKKSFFLCVALFLYLINTTLFAQVSFLARRDFNAPLGSGSITSAVADFNGDDIPDLAIGNAFSHDVSIFLGDGSGGFQFQRSYPVVEHPFSIVVKDFDGDENLDLAVANYGTGLSGGRPAITLLFGDGNGGFPGREDFDVSDINTTVVAADFNNDRILDLAVACLGEFDPDAANDKISVLLGAGDGTFYPALNFPVGIGPEGIDAGDFDRDGNVDLVVANLFSDSITVLLGDGSGGFPENLSTEYSVIPNPPPPSPCQGQPALPSTVVIDDYNKDGYLDIAVLNEGLSSVSVFLGNGDGTFSGPTSYNIPLPCRNPRRMVKGDFNGDGNLDLAVAGGESNRVAILLGDGKGHFSSDPDKIFVVAPPTADNITAHVAIGDFNSDGILDLAVANKGPLFPPPRRVGNMSILTGDGKANFGLFSGVSSTPSSVPTSVTTGDLAGGGKLDLAVANRESNDIRVMWGDGRGGFSYGPILPVLGRSPVSVVMGQFNRPINTLMGIATANFDSDTVSVLQPDGQGGFRPARNFPVGSNPRSVVVGDFNGDRIMDLATANFGSNSVSVLLGDGEGGFRPARTFSLGVGNRPWHINAGIFNSEGRLDLVVVNSGSNDVSILLNNGQWSLPNGGFSEGIRFSVGTSPRSVAVGDYDGDGRLDLAVANFESGNITVLFGDGRGMFPRRANVPLLSGSKPIYIREGDFSLHGNGTLDLAVADLSTNSARILVGNGRGSFSAQGNFFAGLVPGSLAVGAFTASRKPDLVLTNEGSRTISILINDSRR